MSHDDPMGTDWTGREVDLIVSDYFDMLRLELAGEPYVKAHRNAALQELIGRSRGSIEYKHQNISAVLVKLGMPWIPGYKPMANYQGALIDGIERYLVTPGGSIPEYAQQEQTGLAEASLLFIEAPPSLGMEELAEPPALERLVRKFDPAERDARNRTLGKQGEERVFYSERTRLRDIGRPDLAGRVRWVAQEDGDGAGFDIRSFNAMGNERLLEVKTTSGHQRTPFYLSENERLLSVERADAFCLVRLYDFIRKPKAFELLPPLENSVLLSPTIYRASFGA